MQNHFKWQAKFKNKVKKVGFLLRACPFDLSHSIIMEQAPNRSDRVSVRDAIYPRKMLVNRTVRKDIPLAT